MKFHLTQAAGKNLITGYGEGWVQINQDRHTSTFLMTPEQVLAWVPAEPDKLVAEDFRPVISLAPEVLLLGTGPRLKFPPVASLKLLIEVGIGYEIMDTPAACRTYNILMSEGRSVALCVML